jgi:hypothetical protein
MMFPQYWYTEVPTDTPFVTLIEFAAYKGNESLVKYLFEMGVKDKTGRWELVHITDI